MKHYFLLLILLPTIIVDVVGQTITPINVPGHLGSNVKNLPVEIEFFESSVALVYPPIFQLEGVEWEETQHVTVKHGINNSTRVYNHFMSNFHYRPDDCNADQVFIYIEANIDRDKDGNFEDKVKYFAGFIMDDLCDVINIFKYKQSSSSGDKSNQ